MRTHPEVAVIDAFATLCDDSTCAASSGDHLLYRDPEHLTSTGSLLFAPLLLEALTAPPR